ncbi:MAG: MutS family DNA mismatch repair protein, partial [Anaerolineaceae bacterium]|nr:MutS family DNA mismatch repair protein [Anaerolineaceae bacterium]
LQELIPLTGFRNRLASTGMLIQEETKGQWDGDKLLRWLGESVSPRSFLPTLGLLSILAAANIVLFTLNMLGILPAYCVGGLGLYGFIYMAKFSQVRGLFADTYSLGKSLNQFRSVLVFLENASYTNTKHLAQLCEPFIRPAKRPSKFLRKLVWVTIAASLGNNPFLALIINAVVPWNLIFASILNGYKHDLHDSLKKWLDTWYEIEALCSLANYSWLNPGYAFPQMLTNEVDPGQEIFIAQGLGHPLIPENKRVSNDYSIQKLETVAIVTGSNMAGKSTFLRTIGINLCLVNAGGPVAAAELSTRLFRLFTCIQVSDSLADGISYFYAEVRRLKQLLVELDSSSQYPLFFLIDEIYRGTNNRERRIGSQAYIHALSHSQGVGVVSTHDLDLVQLSNLESNVFNYHFREEISGERMVYDYRLREGPSPTTNALKIMAMEGLPVEISE